MKPTAHYPKHPSHIHVSACKVDPRTGATRKTNEDALKLSRFAQTFAQQHGLKKIEQRINNNQRRDRGAYVEYNQVPRADYERFKSYRGESKRAVERMRLAQQTKDREVLSARDVAQKQLFHNQQH